MLQHGELACQVAVECLGLDFLENHMSVTDRRTEIQHVADAIASSVAQTPSSVLINLTDYTQLLIKLVTNIQMLKSPAALQAMSSSDRAGLYMRVATTPHVELPSHVHSLHYITQQNIMRLDTVVGDDTIEEPISIIDDDNNNDAATDASSKQQSTTKRVRLCPEASSLKKCPRCQHTMMAKDEQRRSADEGMTISAWICSNKDCI